MIDTFNDMLTYFEPQYGLETKVLLSAMLEHEEKVALLNPFLTEEKLAAILALGEKKPELGPYIASLPKDLKPLPIDGLLSHYFLDRSSCLAPSLLPLKPGSKVLDMCSAPGGKLISLLSKKVENAFFVANDISKLRLLRLRKVLDEYVPKSFQAAHVQLTNKDASFFGLRQKESYDAILLDAPCGSEAHVLKKNHPFKPQKSLPQRQYALLAAALLAAKPGAFIMYATCSINKNENEGVIKKLLHKKKEFCRIAPLESPLGLKSDYGLSILPHLHGCGPAFISLIEKRM